MARVQIQSLVKRFGGTTAVDGIDIDIEDREFLAIVGPSGCGKSSTLRMISGLEQPTSGHILFGDQDVTRLSADQRDVAMVFQSYALYPHMSVRRNIAFPLENMKLPSGEVAARVDRAAEMLGITALLDRRPRELSGGQRQRVALGRAIVRDAAVFLFDEPLSNLDAKLRVVMRSELKKLHSELGQTFVYVTHDQAEAMTMADRIAVMANGQVQQLGTPEDIYFRPATRFVAEFMGTPSMNMLEGTLLNNDSGAQFSLTGTVHTISLGISLATERHQQSATLGIRPESIALVAPEEGMLRGRIDLVEPLHPDIFISVDIGGQMLLVRTNTSAKPVVGDEVGLRLETGSLHLFDADGKRMDTSTAAGGSK
ncbi:MAG: carbohydrate transporter ATP-binding protein family [Devosia sp.]|uniref:ABC transporter ATP-binding protein n=1 Tax=Devosia sp. TaxID=1871048 RepID=UPI0026118BCA|nr:ABC transporter ATP-binding protein [Devosia sp.]MDB5529896.1 carbohydrate transporter ATP-binding protein family [Devosia sp.]